MSIGLEVLTTQQSADWQRVLDRCAPFDFYHLPGYHEIAEQAGEGAARLFFYTEGEHTIALPLLLRTLNDLPAAQGIDAGWHDATSVYGYAGPICSNAQVPEAIADNFRSALSERLRSLRIVTVFARQHPLLTQRTLLAGLGELHKSRTVAIDLTLPPDVQFSQCRKSYRERINKLRRLGLSIVQDRDGTYLEDFIRIYHENMRRVDAAERYFFAADYYKQLWQLRGADANLFVCLRDAKVICAGLFVACNGILQYHLGATANEALSLSPMKLLVDEVRRWANDQGLRVFHLGGGTTSHPDDSLFHFKMGFSDQTLEFATWRWIVVPEVHDRLCAENNLWNERQGLQSANAGFFPAYRSPTESVASGQWLVASG